MDGTFRVVVAADLHLDAAFAWARPEVARRRRANLREVLRRIVAVADEVGADALLLAGDLYEHDRFTPDTVRFVSETLSAAPCRVFIAPGNHDWYGPTSLYAQADFAPHVHVFTEAGLRPLELVPGLTLWGAAHRAPANTPGFLDGFTVDRGGVHIALFHGAERGGLAAEGEGKQPHAPFDAATIPATGLHHCFVGHHHRPVDAPYHTYPGNPDPLTFGEDGERGVVVADVTGDGTVHRQRRAVAVSTVHDLVVDVTGCTHADAIVDRVRGALAGLCGAVRVTLEGVLDAEVDLPLERLAALAGDDLDVVVPRVGRLLPDLERLASEASLEGRFLRLVREREPDPERQQRLLRLGLRALAGAALDAEVG